MFIPKEHEIYRHFKGNLYEIVTIAEHSESGESLVIYKALYGENKVYARPLDMFTQSVDKEKYPDADQEYRFELQKNNNDNKIDPVVLEFLDADSYEDKLNILTGVRHSVTTDMLHIMATASDVVLPEADVTECYEALKYAVLTKDKYECSHIR